ncbi:hypothetical protein QL285_058200 [Trifolium repens]|jgi:hypothetical protein|nr:hypothetical protein QL285_058200 [Trifolium repens]
MGKKNDPVVATEPVAEQQTNNNNKYNLTNITIIFFSHGFFSLQIWVFLGLLIWDLFVIFIPPPLPPMQLPPLSAAPGGCYGEKARMRLLRWFMYVEVEDDDECYFGFTMDAFLYI